MADILARKGTKVFTIEEEATAYEAARRMKAARIGALVVTLGDGAVVGIVTERDLVWGLLAELYEPEVTPVAQLMARSFPCVTLSTDVEEARRLLKEHFVRHLPVLGPDGALSGLVSIGDVNALVQDAQEEAIGYLTEYLYRRV